uniref:Uncharacterized protein n=1 Tax=Bionectria ochroleuca TaxID=29856 RepID=A0A8H7NF18_BIOOC
MWEGLQQHVCMRLAGWEAHARTHTHTHTKNDPTTLTPCRFTSADSLQFFFCPPAMMCLRGNNKYLMGKQRASIRKRKHKNRNRVCHSGIDRASLSYDDGQQTICTTRVWPYIDNHVTTTPLSRTPSST